jgi:hypothetical protein
MFHKPMLTPYSEQLACVEREVEMRKVVYPKWVAAGKLSQKKANEEILRMEAVAETLRGLLDRESVA